ncbi:hypothetical protein HMPREF3193_00766 [Bifidobacterium breve]|nr:hypothetical protein HMPREF3193_00766 [Bifidobacterium breve]
MSVVFYCECGGDGDEEQRYGGKGVAWCPQLATTDSRISMRCPEMAYFWAL